MSEIDILVLVLSLEGLLLVAIGYAMPGMQTSKLVGVRFPQTLADERVWRDTHVHTGPRFRRVGWTVLLSGLVLTALPMGDALTLALFSGIALGSLTWVIVDSWRYSKARERHYQRVDEGVRHAE